VFVPYPETIVNHSSIPYQSRTSVGITSLPLPLDYWHRPTDELFNHDLGDGDGGGGLGGIGDRTSPGRMAPLLPAHPDVASRSLSTATDERISEEGHCSESSFVLDYNRFDSPGVVNYNRFESPDEVSFNRQHIHSASPSCVSSFRLKAPPTYMYERPPH